jgi:ubiquitin carboxyl-terminal hydrolase 25/28
VKALHEEGSCPPQLQELVATEQSRDRFTLEDVSVAATILGFGLENILHVEYEEDIPDDFVENAWKECVKRSWRDHERGAETHRIANESFRILAEYRGSVRLRAIWENEKNRSMNRDKAYDTLEVPKDVEDYMLITIYNMRVSLFLNHPFAI